MRFIQEKFALLQLAFSVKNPRKIYSSDLHQKFINLQRKLFGFTERFYILKILVGFRSLTDSRSIQEKKVKGDGRMKISRKGFMKVAAAAAMGGSKEMDV